jgi:hypothetical protein
LKVESTMTARSGRLPQEALAQSQDPESRHLIASLILKLGHAGPTPHPPHARSRAW